ncbi:MAG: hypothetical protein Q3977_03845 [Oscillospiraceae bacterium]|nr:hypothetical protein [Oscillospiraceae bacterium]
MKEVITAVLLALALTAGAAGCTATGSLSAEQDDMTGSGVENTAYGNVSTTRNGIVNGDNRNLVAYGEELIADMDSGRR